MLLPSCRSDRRKHRYQSFFAMSVNSTLPANFDEYLQLTNISHWIYRIWTLLFLPLGLAGNILALLIFLHWPHRLSVYIYFSFLCIINMCILLIDMDYHYLLPYIVQESIMIKRILPSACKVIFFLTYFFRYIFIWIIVMINIDRCIYLTEYAQKARLCRQRSAKVICFLVVVLSFLANGHFLLYFNQPIIVTAPSNRTCTIDGLICHCKTTNSNYRYFWKMIWPWYHLTVFALVPLVLMMICSVVIIRHIHTTRRKVMNERRDSTISIVSHSNQNRSIVKTLICLNLLFPLTMFPTLIFQIYVNFYPPRACQTIGIFNVLFSLGFAMIFVKNVFAFVIYYATGSKFRRAFWAMIRCQTAPAEN